MPVAELPEIVVNSKSPGNTPEVVAGVMRDLGYNVGSVEVQEAQPTPEEEANAAATEQAETEAAEAALETERVEKEEKEKKSRNDRRREAKERDQQAIKDATERAERVEREFADFKAKTTSEFEDLRKNPPKAEVAAPELVAPKRPTRAEFFEAADPEAAYEDALLDYGDARRTYQQKLEESKKPKASEPEKPAAAAKPDTQVATQSFDDVLATTKDPTLKRFLTNVKEVSGKHPDAAKAIEENLPNVNPAMISAIHQFDEPARIALYLAKHPDDSKRIKGLTDGNVAEDPRKIRNALTELAKIEQLAAEEDAASGAASGSEEDDEQQTTQPDPEVDAAAARISPQPQRPAAAQKPPVAQTPQPTGKKKATPIDPIGARGAQHEKRYEDMTPDEQRKLSPDEVRKMRGML
jgi:hypothetical protein